MKFHNFFKVRTEFSQAAGQIILRVSAYIKLYPAFIQSAGLCLFNRELCPGVIPRYLPRNRIEGRRYSRHNRR